MDLLKYMKILTSVTSGAIFYLVGLAVFLSTDNYIINNIFVSSLIIFIRWAMLPLITALGFAFGIWSFEREETQKHSKFKRILIWPLAGCIIPSIIIFPFGAMLIVFAMFLGGTLSIILRELMLNKKF